MSSVPRRRGKGTRARGFSRRVRLSFSEGFGRRFAHLGHRRPASPLEPFVLCLAAPTCTVCGLSSRPRVASTGGQPAGEHAESCLYLYRSSLARWASHPASCPGPVNSDRHQRRADRPSFWKEYLPLMYGDPDNGGLFSNSMDCWFVAAPIYSAIITDNHHSRPRSVFLPEARATIQSTIIRCRNSGHESSSTVTWNDRDMSSPAAGSDIQCMAPDRHTS
jgi:hypothetical protein